MSKRTSSTRHAPRRRRIAGRLALVALALAACAGPAYVDRRGPEPGLLTQMLGPVVFEVGQEFGATPPRCIALLPFTSALDQADASSRVEQVRRAIYAHLAPLPSRDVELARVDAILATLPETARRDYPLLGQRLDCDCLLLGTVLEHRERYLGLYSEVVVGAELELVRARDGELLWQARHIASSRGGGLPISLLAVIEGAISAATNRFGETRAQVTDDLARHLVRALPVPIPETTTDRTRLVSAAPG